MDMKNITMILMAFLIGTLLYELDYKSRISNTWRDAAVVNAQELQKCSTPAP